jgi:acyl-CoA synthetase (AMP-forming)/AMP-acid ligase II
MNEFERLTGGRILEGYGMSETVNILTVTPVFTLRNRAAADCLAGYGSGGGRCRYRHAGHPPQ